MCIKLGPEWSNMGWWQNETWVWNFGFNTNQLLDLEGQNLEGLFCEESNQGRIMKITLCGGEFF